MSLVVQTQLYIEDWIGLKALDEAGRVKYVSVPGYHLDISQSDIEEYVLMFCPICRVRTLASMLV